MNQNFVSKQPILVQNFINWLDGKYTLIIRRNKIPCYQTMEWTNDNKKLFSKPYRIEWEAYVKQFIYTREWEDCDHGNEGLDRHYYLETYPYFIAYAGTKENVLYQLASALSKQIVVLKKWHFFFSNRRDGEQRELLSGNRDYDDSGYEHCITKLRLPNFHTLHETKDQQEAVPKSYTNIVPAFKKFVRGFVTRNEKKTQLSLPGA